MFDNRDIRACQNVLTYLKKRDMGGIAQYSVVDVDYKVVRLTNTACIADLCYYDRYHEKQKPKFCVYYLLRRGCKDVQGQV